MKLVRAAGLAAVLGVVGLGCAAHQMAGDDGEPTAATQTMLASAERGRYIVQTSGCNDCHTDGFMQPGGENTPETQWLKGTQVGFRGPWGTTYPSNLRLFAKDFDETTWIQVLRHRNSRPPMPWASLHAMTDEDLKSIYLYLRSFDDLGEKAPIYLPPGQEPQTPYFVFEPVFPRSAMAPQAPGAPNAPQE